MPQEARARDRNPHVDRADRVKHGETLIHRQWKVTARLRGLWRQLLQPDEARSARGDCSWTIGVLTD
jgi:hypothetical protein